MGNSRRLRPKATQRLSTLQLPGHRRAEGIEMIPGARSYAFRSGALPWNRSPEAVAALVAEVERECLEKAGEYACGDCQTTVLRARDAGDIIDYLDVAMGQSVQHLRMVASLDPGAHIAIAMIPCSIPAEEDV